MEMENETRVVMIGRTGNGKSATGNSLVDDPNAFQNSVDLRSVTGKTVRRSANLIGSKTIAVIDTPGMFDTNNPEQTVLAEIVKCIGLSSPGPHAFLYVLKVGTKLTNEEMETLNKYVQLFGKKIYKFLIIVFTYKSKLKGKSIEEYANNAPNFLTELLKLCNNRIITIENKKHTEDRRQTVSRLLNMIQKMKDRSEPFYINEMYFRAEEAIKKRMIAIGRGAERSYVLNEIEEDGEGYKALLLAGVGAIVGGILVGVGVVAVGATSTGLVSGATGLAFGGSTGVTTAVATAVATTSLAAAGAMTSTTAAIVAAGSSCVIM